MRTNLPGTFRSSTRGRGLPGYKDYMFTFFFLIFIFRQFYLCEFSLFLLDVTNRFPKEKHVFITHDKSMINSSKMIDLDSLEEERVFVKGRKM